MNTGACVTRVKELGPGDVVEDKAMTVDEQDDSSVGQQNSALAMLRTGNVRFFSSLYCLVSVSLCLSCLCMQFFTAGLPLWTCTLFWHLLVLLLYGDGACVQAQWCR